MSGDFLRPTSWDDYIGQEKLKAELDVRITASRKMQKPLDHILLIGPPGSGKTTLAQIIASKMQDQFESIIMPVREKALTEIVRLHAGILLIDEIHRAKASQQEDLLPLLQEGFIQTKSGTRIEAKWLTIIGATTEPDKIIQPLWDRFYVPTIDPYSDSEMAKITLGMAKRVGLTIDPDVADVFGVAATGVPRKARQIVLAYRDLMVTNGYPPSAEEALAFLRIGTDGLTADHIAYMMALEKLGGQKGVNVIQSMLELPAAVLNRLERLLIDRDYIRYAPGGRELTTAGYDRLTAERANEAA